MFLGGGVCASSPRAPQLCTCALPPRAESLRRISPATSFRRAAPSVTRSAVRVTAECRERTAAHARHRLVTPQRLQLAPKRRVQPVACLVK